MVRITGWKKINDITWRNKIDNTMVQVYPQGNKYNRTYTYRVTYKNLSQQNKGIINIKTKAKALSYAIRYMKKNPRG